MEGETLMRTECQRAGPAAGDAVIVLAILAGVAALVHFAFVRDWNYDEVSHAHMAWLLSVGEVPYRDFTVNHFPFFWIPVAALMRILPQDPAGMSEPGSSGYDAEGVEESGLGRRGGYGWELRDNVSYWMSHWR